MLEAFFRRWWLYLLVLVPFLALGVVTIGGAGTTYRSSGVVQVNRPANPASNPFGSDTPAAFTSRQINTVLGTEAFLTLLISNAGLNDAVQINAITRQQVRQSVGVGPDGDDLVTVSATNADPDVAQRLADNLVPTYVAFQINNAKETRDTAQQDLADKEANLAQNPQDPQAQLDATDARIASGNAQDALSLQTTSMKQRFSYLDDAKKPSTPEPHRKKDAITLTLFLLLGLMVMAAVVVVAALLDHSVRYSDEIETQLHVPVLAIVPDSRTTIHPMVL